MNLNMWIFFILLTGLYASSFDDTCHSLTQMSQLQPSDKVCPQHLQWVDTFIEALSLGKRDQVAEKIQFPLKFYHKGKTILDIKTPQEFKEKYEQIQNDNIKN